MNTQRTVVAVLTVVATVTAVATPPFGSPHTAQASRGTTCGRNLPAGYQIYTPWGGDGGDNGNGQVQIRVHNFYSDSTIGSGHHPCNDPSLTNDEYALDFGLNTGQRVFPHTGAYVVYAGWATGGWRCYGQIVYVRFTQGLSALYAHLGSIYVHTGDSIDLATVLGTADSTGTTSTGQSCVTASHLHTAIYTNALFYNGQNGIGPYGGYATVPEPIYAFVAGTKYDNLQAGQVLNY
jgi:Peptidase family M23